MAPLLEEIRLPAPGKLNLFLAILGRRSDGYHNLQTLFQLVDRCDFITLSKSRRDVIEIAASNLPMAASENLIFKAASLLARVTGHPGGVSMRLEKHLPVGGGMGGGSSDAASTLVGLNLLWNLGLSRHELLALASRIGADVAVFVQGRTAWGEGIGERLEPVRTPLQNYLVVHPDVQVATARIFSHPDLTRDTSPITIARFLDRGAGNDCESLVRKLHPEVDEVIEWLSQWGPARMTGTGACVFIPLEKSVIGSEILAKLPRKWTGFETRGIARSPLLDVVAE